MVEKQVDAKIRVIRSDNGHDTQLRNFKTISRPWYCESGYMCEYFSIKWDSQEKE